MCCDQKLPAILSILYCRWYPSLSKLAAHTANRYDTKHLTQQNIEKRNMRMSTNCGASHIATHPSPSSPISCYGTNNKALCAHNFSDERNTVQRRGSVADVQVTFYISESWCAGEGRQQRKQWKIYSFLIKWEGTARALSPSRASERQAVECLSIDKAHKLIESFFAFFFTSPKLPFRHQEETCSGCVTCPKSSARKRRREKLIDLTALGEDFVRLARKSPNDN